MTGSLRARKGRTQEKQQEAEEEHGKPEVVQTTACLDAVGVGW